MIAYIRGELISAEENRMIVEAGGIGYEIQIPVTVLENLPAPGSQVKIHTYHSVREDAEQLFGFLTREDMEVFRLLITVNGVGPKGALGILSAVSPDDLRFAVLAEDVKTISSAPGIGPKTAKKLILELKDKFRLEDVFESSLARAEATGERGGSISAEAVEALTALGYSAAEASRAVHSVELTEEMDVETLLKLALKKISFR